MLIKSIKAVACFKNETRNESEQSFSEKFLPAVALESYLHIQTIFVVLFAHVHAHPQDLLVS